MATTTQIQQLKDMLGAAGAGLDDTFLGALIDQYNGDLNSIAADRWGAYASSTATLVTTSESGSSRSLSDIHKNALTMSKYWRDLITTPIVNTSDRPRTRPIERP